MDLKPNYGAFIAVLSFCTIGILPNFFFESLIYAGLSFGFVGFLVFGFLTDTKRVLSAKISGGELLLKTGPFGKKRRLRLNEIRRVLAGKNKKEGQDLIRIADSVFDHKKAKSKYTYLSVEFEKGKFYTIPRYSFSDKNFNEFALRLRNDFSEFKLLPSEKIACLMSEIRKKAAADRKLRNRLDKNLFSAYDSVYASRTAPEIPDEPAILYYTFERNKRVRFFQKNKLKPGMKKENVRLAENLVENARKNMDIAESRIDFYDKTLEKLNESYQSCRNRERLDDVARNLAGLQQNNSDAADRAEQIDFQAAVLIELEALTENIARAETEEKSLLLKKNLNVLLEFKLSGSETGRRLHDLNRKLKP